MGLAKKIGPMLRHPRHSLRMFLQNRKATPVSEWGAKAFGANDALLKFQSSFNENLKHCTWKPHSRYSVFTQYDQDFYLQHKKEFLHKYKCFYAVSKTIAPQRIIELGTHAGSSADAYISATPTAEYIGFDQFDDGVLSGAVHEVDGSPWVPQDVAKKLFAARGFKNFQLMKVDLRSLDQLPLSDFVVVDAAHDFENEYLDLKLALTAKPSYIFVDDVDHPTGTKPALEKFLAEDLKDRVDFYCEIEYFSGGLVIKLR